MPSKVECDVDLLNPSSWTAWPTSNPLPIASALFNPELQLLRPILVDSALDLINLANERVPTPSFVPAQYDGSSAIERLSPPRQQSLQGDAVVRRLAGIDPDARLYRLGVKCRPGVEYGSREPA
jgi:hypothetical protein